MHPNFTTWYRFANPPVQITSTVVDARWTAVDQLAGEAVLDDILQWLTLFCLGKATADSQNRLRAVFQAADTAFLMDGNELELRVLAGAVLVQTIERNKGEYIADVCALGIVCCTKAYPSSILGEIPPGIIDAAELYLVQESERVHELRSVSVPAPTPTALSKAVAKLKTESQKETAKSPMETIFLVAEEILTGQVTYGNAQLAYAKVLKSNQDVLSEENDMLWWVLANHSRTLKTPFSKLSPATAAPLAALELADRTGLLPGHVSAKWLLAKILSEVKQSSKELSLEECVNAVWSQANGLGALPSGGKLLCPHLAAISVCSELAGAVGWIEAFSSSTGLDPHIKATSLDISMAFYQQKILAKCIDYARKP